MKLLRHLHYFVFIFWILVFFIPFFPFFYFLTKNSRYYGVLNKLRGIYAGITTTFAGIFFRFRFEEPLDANQTYIYCANHTSNLDIFLFCLLAKGRFHFMGKEELTRNPILGMFFRSIDIAVQRESKLSSFRAFKRAGENLERGMSLIIFPEGKIAADYPPILHEFKNGPFRLAIEKQVPVVPVSINVWQLMWDDGARQGTRPGIAQIYVHKPISTRILAIENEDRLKEEIYDKIKSKLS